jgi:hypothetical protein
MAAGRAGAQQGQSQWAVRMIKTRTRQRQVWMSPPLLSPSPPHHTSPAPAPHLSLRLLLASWSAKGLAGLENASHWPWGAQHSFIHMLTTLHTPPCKLHLSYLLELLGLCFLSWEVCPDCHVSFLRSLNNGTRQIEMRWQRGQVTILVPLFFP